MEQAPNSQDVGSGAEEEESVADTSDWCSEWSRSPLSSWHEAEKSNLKHDSEREQQDGWVEEQKGGGEDTCDCDSESHSIPWSRVGAAATSKAGQEREVEAELQGGRVQGDDHTIRGEAPIGVEARSEGEGGRWARMRWRGSCTCHAMNLGLKSFELKSEPTDKRDEFLTTLAPVRSARAGGMRLWREEGRGGREAQVVVSLGTEVVVRKDRKAGAEEMAQVGRAAEEVVARPLEKLTGEKPKWQKSTLGKEGEGVASQWRLSHGKSKCGFPRDTRHQHEGDRDDLENNPSG